ncbi:MAG: ribbon-helix-helix domain-containing protein [Candidatus Hodarchaeota archaeon]
MGLFWAQYTPTDGINIAADSVRIRLPAELYKEVAQIYKKEGYSTKTSFIADATRRHLEKLKKEK